MNVSRIHRLLQIVNLLQGHRAYNADELADELQVSRRTVFRDLNALEMAHIPYYYDPQDEGYRINPSFFFPAVNLTLAEALSLLILTGRAKDADDLPLLNHGAQAAAKIESVLPSSIRDHVGSVLDGLSVRHGPKALHEGHETHFNTLAEAVAHRRIVRLRYDSFFEGKKIAVTVHPLRLVFLRRAWYLIAYTPSQRDTRTYKLARILSLNVERKCFARRYADRLADHFGKAWAMIPEGKVHRIQLHFEPKVARNVAEVVWHEMQRVEWNDDGSMEFHVEVDGLNEITWWILGYGDQCRAVKPKALARHVADVARKMAALYDEKGGAGA